ncbi:MAG: PEP-CTERM sorting domain-containing protein [Rubrivivax sp.]|nr:PEP-CTERM sorting domain-containing protein [Rubrivivax sp.]
MKLFHHGLALAAAAVFALPAQALTFSGDTTGGPLWDRPFESLSGISALGSDVAYQVTPFTVTASGVYTFQNTAVGGWDNFTFVYANAFNPAAPLANGVVGNDDNPGVGLSGFSPALTAGTSYFYVVTGFDPAEFGAYDVSVTGPGDVILTAIPEPGTYGLMGLGVAAVLLGARRRRERETA